jgi:hypothetical protein
MDFWKEMEIVNRIEECEREYETLNNFKGIITFQWFLSYKNPSWNKKKIACWIKKREEIRAAIWGNPHPLETPHPLGACNFAIVARCLGNQIIGVGVRVRSTLLRRNMIVMMGCVWME